jgi:hypothetical protein
METCKLGAFRQHGVKGTREFLLQLNGGLRPKVRELFDQLSERAAGFLLLGVEGVLFLLSSAPLRRYVVEHRVHPDGCAVGWGQYAPPRRLSKRVAPAFRVRLSVAALRVRASPIDRKAHHSRTGQPTLDPPAKSAAVAQLVDHRPGWTAVFDELLKHFDGFHRGMQFGSGRTRVLEHIVAAEATVKAVTLRPAVDRELRTLELILGRKT